MFVCGKLGNLRLTRDYIKRLNKIGSERLNKISSGCSLKEEAPIHYISQ